MRAPAATWSRRAAIPVVGAAAVASAATAAIDGDGSRDSLGTFRAVVDGAAQLPWRSAGLLLAVVALGCAHYVLAAAAVRAAAGRRLPLREATFVQFAAAAANRLTVAGVGGAGVNARYLSRRGLPLGAAVTAVASLGILGGLADLVVISTVLGLGPVLGLSTVRPELHALAAKSGRVATVATTALPAPLLAVLSVGGLLLIGGWLIRRLRDVRSGAGIRVGMAQAMSSARRYIAEGVRRPAAVVTLMAASAGTTLVLALAFVATAEAIAGLSAHSVVPLLVGYLLGAAAGAVVPMPGGVGSTEAGLVAALVIGGAPLGTALRIVLIFRVMTFWLPAAVGLATGRRLRARGAL